MVPKNMLRAGRVTAAVVVSGMVACLATGLRVEADLGAVAHPVAQVRLGAEIQLSRLPPPDVEWFHPAVVYDGLGEQYLMVAHNDYAGGQGLYASKVSREGAWRSWRVVFSVSGKDAIQPDVAYNATDDEYLVVWMYDANGDGQTYEIWGRILPIIDHPAAFQIMAWPNRSFWSPRVVWNSARNEYLVVWNAINVSGGLPGVPNDVSGYRIDADGAIINAGSPIVVSSADYPQQVDVAYSTGNDEYLVAWVRAYTAATTGNDIYGARVTWNGTLVAPGAFAIHSAAGHQDAPAVAYDRRTVQVGRSPGVTVERYVVVWEHELSNGEHDIAGRELDGDANPGASVTFVNWLGDDTSPDVARSSLASEGTVPGDDTGWLVVWQHATLTGWSVWGRQKGPGTTDVSFPVASGEFWAAEQPALALAADHRLLVAYESDSVGNPTIKRHIYGRLEWPAGLNWWAHLPLVVQDS